MTPADILARSPMERAKAAYRPFRSVDELVGITERVAVTLRAQAKETP